MHYVRNLVAAVALVAASSAFAQSGGSSQTGSYLQLRLGVFMPQGSDLDGFENGFAFDGAYGYRFHPNFAGEVGIGYLRSEASASAYGMTANATLSDLPITASLKCILPLGPVDLYALLGVGLHSFTFQASVTGVGSASESSSAFGMHAGAGVAFPVTSSVSLGVDLRYLAAKPSFSGASLNFKGLVGSGALVYRF